MCVSCGYEISIETIASMKYANFKIGKVISIVSLDKIKLSVVELDVGLESTINVVTKAKAAYILKDDLLVVATIGAIVPAGANIDDDDHAILVKKSVVGNRSSVGILCDAPMLSWIRGTKGQLVKLTVNEEHDFKIGARPPINNPNAA